MTADVKAERYTEDRRAVARAVRDHGTRLPLYPRPRTRGDCVKGERPCPYVACRYHLFADVIGSGSLALHGDGSVNALAAMEDTCALDVADRGTTTLNHVGQLMSIHRERVRQIQNGALRSLRQRHGILGE